MLQFVKKNSIFPNFGWYNFINGFVCETETDTLKCFSITLKFEKVLIWIILELLREGAPLEAENIAPAFEGNYLFEILRFFAAVKMQTQESLFGKKSD